ncbi:hypothetical protein [Herbaspirillum rubrisubalbicans]|uniref:hypothetical protein n=1 Tax=Herbaspirillum rubrisubalbicans TaxID=80842 RepID=UPI0015C53B30|nr:hypothetical protein [Herbaspirillum rubrisubalbicans]NQE51864.1 hypothetical protein [Herbaspirillum rubrisubalbicans]
MAKKENVVYEIRLTFIDDAKNGFTQIGGAAWLSKEEQTAHWENIPALADGNDSDFVAELIDADQFSILEEKRVTAETCEALMGKSIQMLIDKGRNETCYTLGDVKKKNAQLAAKYPALFGQL